MNVYRWGEFKSNVFYKNILNITFWHGVVLLLGEEGYGWSDSGYTVNGVYRAFYTLSDSRCSK